MRSIFKAFGVAEVLLTLVLTDILLALMGGARTIRLAGWLTRGRASSAEPSCESTLNRIRESYAAATRVYPRHVECLQRALTVFVLSRRRHIQLRFHISVRKFPFASHAWVEYEGPFFPDERTLVLSLTTILTLE